MADNEQYAEDIAQLWGPREEAVVEPPADLPALDASPSHSSGNGSTNGNGNGSHAGSGEPEQVVARLADAIAHHPVGASRADLEALRSDLEGAFAQQLAVALYELMSASNERLATVEEHVNAQLNGVQQAVGEQVGRLTDSMDSHHLASVRELEALGSKLAAVQAAVAGPLEVSTAFQEEIRQEVGRLADVLAEHAGQLTRRSDADAASVAVREQDAAGVANKVGAEMGALSERVAEMQANIAELHRVVADLGDTVAGLRKTTPRERGRARRRRGWSSAP